MPYKNYKKKKANKGKYKKNYLTRLQNYSTPSGFPTSKVALLRYSDTTTLTTTSGILQNYNIRANGCFDPNATGIGHQPMGWDQWTTAYNHYVVLGAKITCNWSLNGTGTASNSVVGCYLADDVSTAYTTYGGFIESKRGTHRFCVVPRNTVKTTSNYSAKKFFNVKDVKDNLDRIGAVVTADPSDQAFFICWAQPLDQTTTEVIRLVYTVEYLVSFSEPKEGTES